MNFLLQIGTSQKRSIYGERFFNAQFFVIFPIFCRHLGHLNCKKYLLQENIKKVTDTETDVSIHKILTSNSIYVSLFRAYNITVLKALIKMNVPYFFLLQSLIVLFRRKWNKQGIEEIGLRRTMVHFDIISSVTIL